MVAAELGTDVNGIRRLQAWLAGDDPLTAVAVARLSTTFKTATMGLRACNGA
jgi:hypothetical protein